MDLTLQPVRIASRHDDEGLLVFADGRLVALLVRLSDLHGGLAGAWFLELAFEALDDPPATTFADLEKAQAWIVARLGRAGG